MKALLHYDASPYLADALRREAPDWLKISVVAADDWQAFDEEIPGTDIVWHVLEPFTAAMMDKAPALKLIQKLGVGVNTIETEAAQERQIAVANMPGSNAQAVAEHTIGLALAVLRNLVPFDDLLRRTGDWALSPTEMDSAGELSGRTLGLVGFGDVAQRVARLAQAFGARVLYTARSPREDTTAEWRSLDTLIAEADILSLHVPLSPETDTLLSAARIAAMKPGAVLINTARGGLVDEPALIEAVRSGRLRGAGLDVFADEPLRPGHPLTELTNVVMTPHVAWLTRETLDRTAAIAVENVRRVRDGEELLHKVA